MAEVHSYSGSIEVRYKNSMKVHDFVNVVLHERESIVNKVGYGLN